MTTSFETLSQQLRAKWQESFVRLNRDDSGINGLMAYSQSWTTAMQYLYPRDLRVTDYRDLTDDEITDMRHAISVVVKCGRSRALLEAHLDNVHQNFHWILEEVEQYLTAYEAEEDIAVVSKMMFRLAAWCMSWAPPEEMGPSTRATYFTTFQILLFSNLSPKFIEGFKALVKMTLPTALTSADNVISEKSQSEAQKQLHNLTQTHRRLWDSFDTLGLLERFESVISSVGYEVIEDHIVSTCAGKWTEPVLEGLRAWMQGRIVPWMIVMYARGATTADEARSMVSNVGSRFEFYMTKVLCDLRTREIFDIIIEYPESNGALTDLKECLARVDQRQNLVLSLRAANAKRLLHPGADTKLILSQYVSTIKCLRIIDPPGVLLFKVADPIRRYLRERPDTIRCIVSNLVGDSSSEGDSLVDDNEPIVPLQPPEAEDYSDPNWEPEPIDAGPDFRTNKPSDVLSTLVSIYDSKDLFVKELQVLLAQRLLAIRDANMESVEKERRNIEILKIRFGEAALQVCEVMLKDMSDSKRIDGHVQSQKTSVIHPTIISRHFWPMLDDTGGGIVMPGQFQTLLDNYAQEFTKFKPDKKLRWLPHLGSADLEIVLEDRTVQVCVPPLEAAFIELFTTKDTYPLQELISLVGGSVEKSAALKALITWIDLGVLKEVEPEVFKLLEIAEPDDPDNDLSRDRVRTGGEPLVDIPPPPTAQEQAGQQMRVFWQFIEGMLTNLGPLPLDKIQTMLRLAPDYDLSIEQLGCLMESARQEEMVIVRDGVWRLIK